ncbi:hypothetical protein [Thermicanus aegyptius]|uniref:hypothetical protein n=1 Tax=Thermicanus aegyptius TaxID=94009 RepID=UPI0004298458|nr:hypothetical protein [Thermicanus aegyptius]
MKIRKLKKFSVNATLLLFTFFYFLTSVIHPVYAQGEINPVDTIKYGKTPNNPSSSGDSAKENYKPKEKSDTWGIGQENFGGDLTPEEKQQKLREDWWKKAGNYQQYVDFKNTLDDFVKKYQFDYGQGGYMWPNWWPWWWFYKPSLDDEKNNEAFINARNDAQKISKKLDELYAKAHDLRTASVDLYDGVDVKASSIVPVLAANLKLTLDDANDNVIPVGVTVDEGGYDPQAKGGEETKDGIATQVAKNFLNDQANQPDWFERTVTGPLLALLRFIHWIIGAQDIIDLAFHSDKIYGEKNIEYNSGLPTYLWNIVETFNKAMRQYFSIPVVIMLALAGLIVIFRAGSPGALLLLKDQIIKTVGIVALLFFGDYLLKMIFAFIDSILYIIQLVAGAMGVNLNKNFIAILFGTTNAAGTDSFDSFTKISSSFVIFLIALTFIVFNAIYTFQYTMRIFWMVYHLAAFPFVLIAALQPGKKGVINQWLSDFLGHALLPVYHGIAIVPFLLILKVLLGLESNIPTNAVTPIAGPGAGLLSVFAFFFLLLKAPRFIQGLFSRMFSGGEMYHRLDSAAAGTTRSMIGGAIGYGIGRMRGRFSKRGDFEQDMPGRRDGNIRNPDRRESGGAFPPAQESDVRRTTRQPWEKAKETTEHRAPGHGSAENIVGHQTLQPTAMVAQQEKNLSAIEQTGTQKDSTSQDSSASKGSSFGAAALRGLGRAAKAVGKGAYFAGRKFTKYGVAFTAAAAATATSAMMTGEVNTGTFQRVFRSAHTAMTNASTKYRGTVEKAAGTAAKTTGVAIGQAWNAAGTAAKATGAAIGQAWNKVRGKAYPSPQEDSRTNTSAQSKAGNFGQEAVSSRDKTVEGGVPLRNEKTFQDTAQENKQPKQENQDQENAGEIRVLTPEESKAIRESGKVIDMEKAGDTYVPKQDKK